MSDNLTIPASGTGTATPVVATDDVSGVHYQRVKLVDGVIDGTTALEFNVDDFDSGGGTDNQTLVGIAVAASGGHAAITGDVTNGLDVDVTRLPALAAGTNNIGDVDVLSIAAGNNNIGDVDVASIAAGDNNIGNVDIVSMPNVTLAAGTNTNEVVGDVAQDAPVAGNPVLVGGRASAAAPTDMSLDGDAVHIWTTLKGAVNVADAGGSLTVDGTVTANLAAGTNNIGDVDILSIAAGNNNIGDVDVASIAAGDNNIGNVDVVTMPNVTVGTMANLTESLVDDAGFSPAVSRVLPVGFEVDDTGTDSVDEGDIGAARMSANRNVYMRIRDNAGNERGANVDASGNLNVIAGSNSGVDIGDVTINNSTGGAAVNIQDGGNSITVDGSVTATLAAGTNTNEVVGDAAHGASIAGNPVRVGGRAVNAEVTAVSNGQTADIVTDLVGKQITLPYANPENFVSGLTSDITGTSDTQVIATPGASVRLYITHILVTNSHATVGTFVNIKDDTTSIYTGYAAPAGGGFSITLPVPLRLTANKPLNAANATTGSNTRVSASGYKGA